MILSTSFHFTLPSLKLTHPLKIGRNNPKRKPDRLPTPNFQGIRWGAGLLDSTIQRTFHWMDWRLLFCCSPTEKKEGVLYVIKRPNKWLNFLMFIVLLNYKLYNSHFTSLARNSYCSNDCHQRRCPETRIYFHAGCSPFLRGSLPSHRPTRINPKSCR